MVLWFGVIPASSTNEYQTIFDQYALSSEESCEADEDMLTANTKINTHINLDLVTVCLICICIIMSCAVIQNNCFEKEDRDRDPVVNDFSLCLFIFRIAGGKF